ncbi:MAG: hypothetical protein QF415_07980 [Candidatus Undinarchaeales archaeon]|nr:hypothetical protein [Candidatus Undinarchaeales archaeon]MDP7492975.1 hypothetical protein [Candidatus Undinarchaeales archaeon]
MASGIWRGLSRNGKLAAAITIDVINMIPLLVFAPADLLVAVAQWDYVTDLRGSPADPMSIFMGLEAVLPGPFDLTPVCLLTFLRTEGKLGADGGRVDIPPDADVIDVDYRVRDDSVDDDDT